MSGKVKAYGEMGVKLRNIRWSWSGRTSDGRVVLSIWKEQIDWNAKPPRIDIFEDDRLADMMSKPGNKERIENLKWARDRYDGVFELVLTTAVDFDASPRVIARAEPSKLKMKLVSFDEISGEFSAQVVERGKAESPQR